MNPQDLINQNIRLALGNLQVELILAQARIQELELALKQATEQQAEVPVPEVSKPNGHAKENLNG